MDHHGSPSRIVRRDVRELETLRQIIVNLDGSELPFAPNHVFDHEINLRSIERGLPSFLGKGYSERLHTFAKARFSPLPLFGGSDVLCRVRVAQSNPDPVGTQSQRS